MCSAHVCLRVRVRVRVRVFNFIICTSVSHRAQLIHRDVAARNFLISDQGRVVLSDFGLSRKLSPANLDSPTPHYEKTRGYAEPFHYWAPEVFKNKVSTKQSDMWMFGKF